MCSYVSPSPLTALSRTRADLQMDGRDDLIAPSLYPVNSERAGAAFYLTNTCRMNQEETPREL